VNVTKLRTEIDQTARILLSVMVVHGQGHEGHLFLWGMRVQYLSIFNKN